LLPDAFDAHILEETDGGGVDVILDPVGAPYFERNLNVLAPRGRSVCIATMGGSTVSLSLSVLQRKRLKLIGTVLRNRTLAEKVQATRAFERDVVPKIAAEHLSPIVDRSFSLEQAPDAYKYMEENRNFGKIVLTMG
jgi:NADPH:quinone reductase-like Zn-dependent oxidoreductase